MTSMVSYIINTQHTCSKHYTSVSTDRYSTLVFTKIRGQSHSTLSLTAPSTQSWMFKGITTAITRQIQLGRPSNYGLQYRKCFTLHVDERRLGFQYSKGATAGTPFMQNHTTRSRSRRIIFKMLGLNRETEETKAQFWKNRVRYHNVLAENKHT